MADLHVVNGDLPEGNEYEDCLHDEDEFCVESDDG